MNEIISVIVPVFNVEMYVERCIKSLIRQTYQDIEILLIDDGSTDNSGVICDKYSYEDDRIKVYHKANGGLSDARNYGIDRCQGKYITFVDSDDYVSDHYVEILYHILKEHSADISICASKYVYDESFKIETVVGDAITRYSSREAIVETLLIRLSHRAWGKLYKIELFESLRFPVGYLYEDLAVVYDLLMMCTSVVYTNTPAYYYLIRSGSIMQSSFNIRHADELEIVDQAMDKVETAYPELQNLANARRLYSYFIVLRRIMLSDEPEKYLELRMKIRNKIKTRSKGLLRDTSVSRGIKIKLISYIFGEKAYMTLQRIADKRNPEVQ